MGYDPGTMIELNDGCIFQAILMAGVVAALVLGIIGVSQ